MTTDRALVSRLTREFCGSRKLWADNLLVSRLSRRPPPMTTNHGHDRDRFFSYSFIYSARLRSDGQNPAQNGAGKGARESKHLDGGRNCRIDVKA